MAGLRIGQRIVIKASGLAGRIIRIPKISGAAARLSPAQDRLIVVRLDRPDEFGDKIGVYFPYEIEPEPAEGRAG